MNNLKHPFANFPNISSNKNNSIRRNNNNDRFIPIRNPEAIDITNYDLLDESKPKTNLKKLNQCEYPKSVPIFTSYSPENSNKKKYSMLLRKNILTKDQIGKGSLLSFTSKSQTNFNKTEYKTKSIFDLDLDIFDNLVSRNKALPKKAYKILDCPEMEDDFYKQLLHWSPVNNMVAIGLSNSVYLWDAHLKKATLLCTFFEYEELCSLRWGPNGNYIAFGMDSGEIKIWDLKKNKYIQSIFGHSGRVGTLDWKDCIFSGSKDRSVQMTDPRIGELPLAKFKGHSKQVLNVKQSPNNYPYILSGGNDNKVLVFDLRKEEINLFKATHKGPVRAIDWSSQRKGIFASGGGSADMTVKLWNLNEQRKINEVKTGAQVCDLKFSSIENEIVVSLGGEFDSIEFYHEKDLRKVGSLKGHSDRVLNIDFSPNMTELVSVSPDETMRFWEINNLVNTKRKPLNMVFSKFESVCEMR